MEKKKRSRGSAIIPYEDGIITIHRVKGTGDDRQEYYTIPGGGQKEGESIEETTRREIKEELGVDIELTSECYQINACNRDQFFYVAKHKEGTPGTGQGPEMTNIDYDKYGSYQVEIVHKDDLEKINLLPAEVKDIILENKEGIFGE